MAAAQQGDQAAYARLLAEVIPWLRAVLRSRAPAGMTEDTVQDVLLSLHRMRASYDPARPFRPWLMAIACRRAADAHRAAARDRRCPATDAQPPPDPDAALDASRLAVALHGHVAALPAGQRVAVQLVKLQDLSVADAATCSGSSPGAMRINVHRGLVALRRRLGA